jgi:hypothetical protein
MASRPVSAEVMAELSKFVCSLDTKANDIARSLGKSLQQIQGIIRRL